MGKVVTRTNNYIANFRDDIIVFTITTAKTLTLPSAVGISGKEYTILVYDLMRSAANVTIKPVNSELIAGTDSIFIDEHNSGITIVSDGTKWLIKASTGVDFAAYSEIKGNLFATGPDNTIGVSSGWTKLGGLLQGNMQAETISTASDSITPTDFFVYISISGDVVASSTPTILDPVKSPAFLVIFNGGTANWTLTDDSILAGSNLKLGATSRTLTPGDTLVLHWPIAGVNFSKWHEISFVQVV